jgi:hypothetical protein
MTIYFTNGQSKTIENLADFSMQENYLLIKTGSKARYDGTIYVPLYNVLYITRD